MSRTNTLSLKTIRQRFGDHSYQKGESYFRSGAIIDPRRVGPTLKAKCHGSSGGPYRVTATLAGDTIADADCSCPVGDGGLCKHVVALLLTWREQPDEFVEVEVADAALDKLDKAELIALVKRMIAQEPDLERLLEKPRRRGGGQPATAEEYRKRAKRVFRDIGEGDGAAGGIVSALEPLLTEADDFFKAGDMASATAAYQGLTAALADHGQVYDDFDEEGSFGQFVASCVDGLSQCLDAFPDDPSRREVILRTLWDVERSDLEPGDFDNEMTPTEVFRQRTTPDEKRMLAGWVRAAMPKGEDWGAKHQRNAYGGLLLDLEAETMDDATFLRVCRESGRTEDLIDKLLALGRVDEAAREADKVAESHSFLQLINLFKEHKQEDVAERLVAERAKKSPDARLVAWLRDRAVARKDAAAALDLTERLFRLEPRLPTYEDLAKRATAQGTWDKLRPQLLQLLDTNRDRVLLIDIALQENDIDRALAELKKESRPGWGATRTMEVAKAAEKPRPREAREIYRKEAESLIDHRNRTAYQQACPFLKKVRDLYRAVGEEAAWTAYIDGLKTRYSALRALKEELNKAKL